MSPDSPKRKLAAIMFTNIACGLGSLPDDRNLETTPADGGTNPAESGAPLDPLLTKEGKPMIPLYQEGWILSRLFGTKDGVCQEYWYNQLIVLTGGNFR